MTDERVLVARRSFYLLGIYALWAIISIALAIPAVIYLLIPPRTRKGGGFVDATDLTRLPLGQPEEIIFRRVRSDGWKVTTENASAWVVRASDHSVTAFAPQCTHLGCAYHWEASQNCFLCPCHTSTFSVDGRVTGGPAPRPLDRYQVKLEGNRVLLGQIERSENA
jgi:menaquinol-cytochrome c reductase iron-sulfur subunit